MREVVELTIGPGDALRSADQRFYNDRAMVSKVRADILDVYCLPMKCELHAIAPVAGSDASSLRLLIALKAALVNYWTSSRSGERRTVPVQIQQAHERRGIALALVFEIVVENHR